MKQLKCYKSIEESFALVLVMERCKDLWKEIELVNQRNKVVTHTKDLWKKPPLGTLKVNCDEATMTMGEAWAI